MIASRLPSVQRGYARTPGESEYPGLWKGLLRAYEFGMQPDGNRIYDFSGHHQDGNVVNAPSWVSSEYGRALRLNGTSQYVTVPDWDSTHNRMAVFSRMNLRNQSNFKLYPIIGSTEGDTNSIGVVARTGGPTHYNLDFYSQSGVTNVVNFGGGPLMPEGFFITTFVYRDSAFNLKGFINGSEATTGTPSNSGDWEPGFSTNTAQLGRRGTTKYSDADFLEILVYDNRVLDAPEYFYEILHEIPYAPFVKRRRVYGFSAAVAGAFPPNSLALTGVGR